MAVIQETRTGDPRTGDYEYFRVSFDEGEFDAFRFDQLAQKIHYTENANEYDANGRCIASRNYLEPGDFKNPNIRVMGSSSLKFIVVDSIMYIFPSSMYHRDFKLELGITGRIQDAGRIVISFDVSREGRKTIKTTKARMLFDTSSSLFYLSGHEDQDAFRRDTIGSQLGEFFTMKSVLER